MGKPVVVWLSRGGIVDVVAAVGVDVVIVDFQNLEAGDAAPDLTEDQTELLRHSAPQVLADMNQYVMRYVCENCRTRYHGLHQLLEVRDLDQRVAAGEPIPVGECPECHAVVHPIDDDWYPVPQTAVKRLDLSASFVMSAGAVPVVHRLGLDRVLSVFAELNRQSVDPGEMVGKESDLGTTGLKFRVVFDPGSSAWARVEIFVR